MEINKVLEREVRCDMHAHTQCHAAAAAAPSDMMRYDEVAANIGGGVRSSPIHFNLHVPTFVISFHQSNQGISLGEMH